MNIPEDLKAFLNFMKLTFFLFLLVHFVGCFWFMVCSINKDSFDKDGMSLVWYPPTDWVNYTDTKLFDEDTRIFYQILVSLYHGVLMLGSNEIGPVNVEEMGYCVFVLLFMSIVNAQLFGEMAVLI